MDTYVRLLRLWSAFRGPDDEPFWKYSNVDPASVLNFVSSEFDSILPWHAEIFSQEELGVCYYCVAIAQGSVGLFHTVTRLHGPSRNYDVASIINVFIEATKRSFSSTDSSASASAERVIAFEALVRGYTSIIPRMSPRVYATLLACNTKRRAQKLRSMVAVGVGACARDDLDVITAANIVGDKVIVALCEGHRALAERGRMDRISGCMFGPFPEAVANVCSTFPELVTVEHFINCHPANDDRIVLNALSLYSLKGAKRPDLDILEQMAERCSRDHGLSLSSIRLSDLFRAMETTDPQAWKAFVIAATHDVRLSRCPLVYQGILGTVVNAVTAETARILEIHEIEDRLDKMLKTYDSLGNGSSCSEGCGGDATLTRAAIEEPAKQGEEERENKLPA